MFIKIYFVKLFGKIFKSSKFVLNKNDKVQGQEVDVSSNSI